MFTLTCCIVCECVERGLIPWQGPVHDRSLWATSSPAQRQRVARLHGLVLAPGGRAWGDETGPWIAAPKDAPLNPAETWDETADGLHARVEAAHRRTRRKKGCRRPVGVPRPPAAINMEEEEEK
jgi:hypothetical protein